MKYLLTTVLLLSFFSFGQTRDAELWLGVGLKADLTKKFSAKYESQTRFYKNVSTLKQYYNEVSLDYEITKDLSLGASYRYSRKNREGHFAGENRFCINLAQELKFGDSGFELKARGRYQYAFNRLTVINESLYPDQKAIFRLKLDLEYEIEAFKRITPFGGYELFKGFQANDYKALDAYRLYIGLDFDLPARHEVSIKYIFERENRATPFTGHIYVVQYNYALKSKLFKKKKN